MPNFKVKSPARLASESVAGRQKSKVKNVGVQIGYTLIELLVVIAIIAIISAFVLLNYKDLSTDKILDKAQGQVQSLLRFAQSNASNGLKCGDSPSTEWFVKFHAGNEKNILDLNCKNSSFLSPVYQTLTLDRNVEISGINTGLISHCKDNTISAVPFPDGSFTVSFKTISGEVGFFLNREAGSPVCELKTDNLSNIPVTVSYNKSGVLCSADDATCKKTFNLGKAGSVDVQ